MTVRAQRGARAGADETTTGPPEPPLRSWPADAVERWPLERIRPSAGNVLIHTPEQVEQIAASMLRFGVTAPVLVDEEDGTLIYGHGRLLGAQLNLARGHAQFAELPVTIARGWSEDEKRAYRIADNALGRSAEWDMPALRADIGALKLSNFDLPLLGFPEIKLAEFLSGVPGHGDPPITPEQARQTLAERFGAVPFSVLNAREGWWQDRKRAWIALGIQSELGRGERGGLTWGTTCAPYKGESDAKG